jgi:hypothetical protein
LGLVDAVDLKSEFYFARHRCTSLIVKTMLPLQMLTRLSHTWLNTGEPVATLGRSEIGRYCQN